MRVSCSPSEGLQEVVEKKIDLGSQLVYLLIKGSNERLFIMKIQEIQAKSILSKSKVHDWTINPYRGCQHGCTYCYARFMKRFTNHREDWGEFVDVKVNAPELLAREVEKKRRGGVWISGVCDPYQPVERKYELTKRCLKILQENDWPVIIQTKSPLVLRDLQLLKRFVDMEVSFTITSGDERIRKIFEPQAPPISQRVEALGKLHCQGVRTCAMIAPILPGADTLVPWLEGKVDRVIVDRMNYHYADWVYRKHGLEEARDDSFFAQKRAELIHLLEKHRVAYQVVF